MLSYQTNARIELYCKTDLLFVLKRKLASERDAQERQEQRCSHTGTQQQHINNKVGQLKYKVMDG